MREEEGGGGGRGKGEEGGGGGRGRREGGEELRSGLTAHMFVTMLT